MDFTTQAGTTVLNVLQTVNFVQTEMELVLSANQNITLTQKIRVVLKWSTVDQDSTILVTIIVHFARKTVAYVLTSQETVCFASLPII